MFNKFLKSAASNSAAAKSVVVVPGLEVVEDDPETAWSEWDSVLSEQDALAHAADPAPLAGSLQPDINVAPDFDAPTQPLSLDDMREVEKNHALAIVHTHHPRIAQSIRTLWGYKECSTYIDRLIINGNDGSGHTRAGFHHEAVEAMLKLTHLHDERFGDFGGSQNHAHNDFRVPTAWDHLG
jgi:hypothetical protein